MIMIRCVELSRHEFANIKIKILRIYTLIGSECISQQSKPINFVEVRLKIRLGGMNYCSHKLGNICVKLPIFGEVSKKYLAVVYAEDAAVAYFSHLARMEQLDVAPAAIKRVTQGYDVEEFEDRAVGFPY